MWPELTSERPSLVRALTTAKRLGELHTQARRDSFEVAIRDADPVYRLRKRVLTMQLHYNDGRPHDTRVRPIYMIPGATVGDCVRALRDMHIDDASIVTILSEIMEG